MSGDVVHSQIKAAKHASDWEADLIERPTFRMTGGSYQVHPCTNAAGQRQRSGEKGSVR